MAGPLTFPQPKLPPLLTPTMQTQDKAAATANAALAAKQSAVQAGKGKAAAAPVTPKKSL